MRGGKGPGMRDEGNEREEGTEVRDEGIGMKEMRGRRRSVVRDEGRREEREEIENIPIVVNASQYLSRIIILHLLLDLFLCLHVSNLHSTK